MLKVLDYCILEETDVSKLEERIKEKLAAGWQLNGFLTSVYDGDFGRMRYIQSMIRYEETPQSPFYPYYAPPIPPRLPNIEKDEIYKFEITC